MRQGKEPAERSRLNNPGINTGLGKLHVPPSQRIQGIGSILSRSNSGTARQGRGQERLQRN